MGRRRSVRVGQAAQEALSAHGNGSKGKQVSVSRSSSERKACMAIVTILEVFIGKLIGKEIEAWLSQGGRRLLNYAVSKLPAHERSRFAEEWSADLANIPGDLSKA